MDVMAGQVQADNALPVTFRDLPTEIIEIIFRAGLRTQVSTLTQGQMPRQLAVITPKGAPVSTITVAGAVPDFHWLPDYPRPKARGTTED
jgi:hypothetical protein